MCIRDRLFQLTDEELSASASLFKDDAVKTSLLQSYVFIAIELKEQGEGDYARGKLAGIARQINRIFPMPVMVPVSYTHLDVYKRQFPVRAGSRRRAV